MERPLLLISVALRVTVPFLWQGVCDIGDWKGSRGPGTSPPHSYVLWSSFHVGGWVMPPVVPTHRDLSPGTSGPLHYSPQFDWPQLSASQYLSVIPTCRPTGKTRMLKGDPLLPLSVTPTKKKRFGYPQTCMRGCLVLSGIPLPILPGAQNNVTFHPSKPPNMRRCWGGIAKIILRGL